MMILNRNKGKSNDNIKQINKINTLTLHKSGLVPIKGRL
jgi:hypothetical protein